MAFEDLLHRGLNSKRANKLLMVAFMFAKKGDAIGNRLL
jgi:hypothetical protein